MVRSQDLLCKDDQRRELLRAADTLHGLDYLEVRTQPPADNQLVLALHFIGKNTAAGAADLDTMLADFDGHGERFSLSGGVRITRVRIEQAVRNGTVIELRVSEPGDFSLYTLRADHPRLDPVFSQIEFSFKAGCPTKFDCKPVDTCPLEEVTNPAIDYMAKDYASFRQALLDRLTVLNPDWRERSPADLGIAMIELMAYAADYLSYYQDAVGNEAYLETARQRISVRRHGRLIDYRMHDGLSARAFVHVRVSNTGVLPAGTQFLTRLTVPLRGTLPPHGFVIAPQDADAAVAATAAVFATEREITVYPALWEIGIHAWGRAECCLPLGAATADLIGDLTAELSAGALLLFEEVKGTSSGLPQDADLARRQVVRLTSVVQVHDPLLNQALTRVTWDSADTLAFPFCVSSLDDKGSAITGVTVARGNIILVHHGRRIAETHTVTDAQGYRYYRCGIEEGPVSQWLSSSGLDPVSALLAGDPHQAGAQVEISGWTAVDSLLNSVPNDRHFVTEMENQGGALLRFGDGTAGRRPDEAEVLHIFYRTGVGSAGSVAAHAIAHAVNPGNLADWPVITEVRNPLPSWGGIEPETIEEVKLTAPAMLRTGLYRAVTEGDYAQAAQMLPEVSKAVATFRWTGFWHTVFLTIDPVGGGELSSQARNRIELWVRQFLQVGYDLRIDSPVYVPLEIAIDICVDPHHFRTDVYQALLRELGTRQLPGGRKAFFHPDNFTFGQPLYLSQLYAAITTVEGVRSVNVTQFQRLGRPLDNELLDGVIHAGRTEVIRLDNDPNFAERGVLTLNLEGGK